MVVSKTLTEQNMFLDEMFREVTLKWWAAYLDKEHTMGPSEGALSGRAQGNMAPRLEKVYVWKVSDSPSEWRLMRQETEPN